MRTAAIIVLLATIISCTGGNPPFEEGFKKINGVEHYYKIVGEGKPIVILHGGPGMYHDELFPFLEPMAEQYRLIFYDQRGNGHSEMETIDSTNFTEELMVKDLEELRKAFRLDKFTIVGHSWGGLLAMYYTTAYPENVDKLILVDAAPVNSELLIQCYYNLISMFDPADWERVEALWNSEAYANGDPDVHNEAMRISEGVTFSSEEAIDRYMEVAAFNERTAKNTIRIGNLATKIKMNITVQDQIERITCPTLMIYGENDFVVDEAIDLTHELIKNSELIRIPGAGHYPHIENPEVFLSSVIDFLETE